MTLEPSGGCLPDVDPAPVPSSAEPVDFTLGQPDDAPLRPWDITFAVAFPNGSVQTVITPITVVE